ncbi:MAG: transposase [Jatrophihabitantaceae bacterium]
MTRAAVLSDEAWARIEPLLPPVNKAMGRPSRPHRPVVEGMIYRARTGVPWRDLPADFGRGRPCIAGSSRGRATGLSTGCWPSLNLPAHS